MNWTVVRVILAAVFSGLGGGAAAFVSEKLNDQRYKENFERHMKEKEQDHTEPEN